MRALLLRTVLAAAVAVALAGASCEWSGSFNGTGSSLTVTNNQSTVSNASATGVWSGSDSVSGLSVSALIDAAGLATFIRSDGVQFVGQVTTSGNTLAASVQGYSDFGTPFSDGSTSGSGTLNGTVTSGATLSATLIFSTAGNTPISGTWALAFEALSNDGSSLAAISGNYRDTTTAAVLSINSDGVMTSQDPADHCVLNGSVTTHDGAHDLYEVSFSYGDCTGAAALLNGVGFTGLATLNSGAAPVQLTMAVTGSSPAGRYALVSSFDGT
jgi:hypothetical protein